MPRNNFVAAVFPMLAYATGAVDWFRNQGIDADAIVIAAKSDQGALRLPQRGDNMRPDLKWVVALDLDAAHVSKAVARETLQREGGRLLKQIPDDLPVADRR